MKNIKSISFAEVNFQKQVDPLLGDLRSSSVINFPEPESM